MLRDLHTDRSLGYRCLPNKAKNWDHLMYLVNNNKTLFPKIDFTETSNLDDGRMWQIREFVGEESFVMQRSMIKGHRNTIKDLYGLIGLSSINPKDTSVILTEGVSDYFTAKLLEPKRNVLGVTTLSGSTTAKKILINLFDNFLICADNDATSSKNTGVSNAYNLKKFLESFGKSVTIFTPQVGFKDITDNFVFNLKLNQ